MNRKLGNTGKFVKQLSIEITGSIFIAAAIYNFAVQAQFPMTGFSGISIILYRLFHIPIGLSTILLNIPVIFLDMDGIIYGMIVNYLFAFVVDKMMYGINAGKMALIVTCNGHKICKMIDNCCQWGWCRSGSEHPAALNIQ